MKFSNIHANILTSKIQFPISDGIDVLHTRIYEFRREFNHFDA